MPRDRTPARRTSRRDDDIIDLRGVDASGGNRSAHLPIENNPYTFTIDHVEEKVGNDSGQPYLNVRLKVGKGPFKGKTIFHTCTMQPQGLFNLRQLIEACGIDAERQFRRSQLIKVLPGKTLQADVTDDEYNGKVKSIIDYFILEGEEVAEDPEDDEEEEVEEEEVEEEEEEEDEEPAPRRRAAAPARATATATPARRAATTTATRASRNGVTANKRVAATAAPARGRGRRAAADEDDEEIDDLELDDLL